MSDSQSIQKSEEVGAMYDTIMSIDPGGTTGWSLWTKTEIKTGEISEDEHHGTLAYVIRFYEPELIICESFEYRNTSPAGLNLIPVEYIGIVKLVAVNILADVEMQTASIAKGFVKDENIKRLGLWEPGKPHAMDALRHLLFYIVNRTSEPIYGSTDILERGWKS